MRDCRSTGALARVGGPRRLLGLLLLATLGLGVAGCTRYFYRNAADKEVNDILAEKNRYPAWWKIEQFHVYPDPRARFADPSNPDRPPMPPDDPASWDLAPHPQHPGRAGVGTDEGTAWLEIIKIWDEQNRAGRTDAAGGDKRSADATDAKAAADSKKGDPADQQKAPIQKLFDEAVTSTTQPGFLLDLDQTVELGLINAREYQSIREDLYLAALPVTQQRFSFAWQWTAIENAVRQWAGPESSVGAQNNWTLTSTLSVSKLFSTGALLTAAFANDTVFNFLNVGRGLTSVSTINLDIVQPLLRGGGRAVTLEPLTQAERNLVYNVRAYARFREQFYLSITLGTSPPGTLASAAGTTGGGLSPISTLAALGIASTDVSGQFKGYLPTLFRQIDWAVDLKYVRDLEKALKLFEGFQEGGQVAPLQVTQVRSTLLNAENTVLNDVQFKTNALDQFKLQLGIPANLPLILDDAPARPITRSLDLYYEILAESDAAVKRLEAQQDLPAGQLRGFLRRLFADDPLVRGTAFQKNLPGSWEAWRRLSDKALEARMKRLGQERRKLLDLKTDLELKGKTLSAEQARRMREAEFEGDLGLLEQILRRYEARPWAKAEGVKESQRRLQRTKLFREVAYAAGTVGVYARNDRFEQAGRQWPELPAARLDSFDMLNSNVDEAQQVAVQAALTDRIDLMNARAQVVDAWRQLRVTANALLGVFNVSYHLDSRTPPTGSNPLAFAPSRTNQELILNAQLPLVRLNERNAYRTALINYQRARRALMSLEDNIAAQVRFDVRQLHLFAANYKIQQKVVEAFYSQVENALEVIIAPTDPDALKATGTAGQANAAALTNQYLQALQGLNGAQSQMYRIWLSYLATRMQLFLDLERLPLDLRGVWIDESGNSPNAACAGGGASLGQPVPGDERGAAAAGGATLGQPLTAGERGPVPPTHLPGPRLLAPPAPPGLE
jgi:hypothetical protein